MVEDVGMTFIDAIRSQSYQPPHEIIDDGKIHRFATDPNKPRSKDGWYAYHLTYGVYGSHRDGSQHTWFANSGYKPTKSDIAKIAIIKKQAAKALEEERNETALLARQFYDNASVYGDSPYLTKKKIPLPTGVKFINKVDAQKLGFEKSFLLTALIVPLKNKNGELRSLQFINGEGNKFFLPHGELKGCFFTIGEIKNGEPIIIAEGMATAMSCNIETKYTAISAFSAHNLKDVSLAIRALAPNSKIYNAADGDEAGRKAAREASEAINGIYIEAPEGKDFNDVPIKLSNKTSEDFKWREDLIIKTNTDGEQSILCRAHNLVLILENGKEFNGLLKYNAFSEQLIYKDLMLADHHITEIQTILEKRYIKDKVNTNDVSNAINLVAHKHLIHPVRDYLNSLKWDGRKRIHTFFPDYLKVEYSTYHQDVSKYLFMAGVNRIFVPGCKCDGMIILEGKQGIGKSRLWAVLGGEYYVDIATDMNNPDFSRGLHGVWIVDMGELDQFTRADVSRIKKMLTIQEDYVRLPYARTHQRLQRQNIFVGGTNRSDWLNDPTGGRRFYPVACPANKIDIDAIARVRDQLWAEAVVYYKNQEIPGWWEVRDAEEHQNDRYQEDVWTETIARYMNDRTEVSTADILSNCLNIEKGRHGKSEQMRVTTILHRMGYERTRKRVGGVLVYVFTKVGTP
jgi:putative DNA primase/helicase